MSGEYREEATTKQRRAENPLELKKVHKIYNLNRGQHKRNMQQDTSSDKLSQQGDNHKATSIYLPPVSQGLMTAIPEATVSFQASALREMLPLEQALDPGGMRKRQDTIG